jgi:hypothetical protein
MTTPGDGFGPVLIVFDPQPHPIPAAVRVRHLLKRALRDWALKARVIRDPTPEEIALAAAAPEPVTPDCH